MGGGGDFAAVKWTGFDTGGQRNSRIRMQGEVFNFHKVLSTLKIS